MSQARKERGKTQRLYLLDCKYNNNEWIFTVKGLTNTYTINLNMNVMTCNCHDFINRQKTCKHLYFILSRIAQNELIIKLIETNEKKYNFCYPLGENMFTVLTTSLTQRLKARFKQIEKENNKDGKSFFQKLFGKNTQNKTFIPDQECSICYEIINQNDNISQCEKQCKQYFHKECILLWLDTSQTCPLCRIKTCKSDIDPKFKIVDKNYDDPMLFLSTSNIKINL
jgi:hypothetical protein